MAVAEPLRAPRPAAGAPDRAWQVRAAVAAAGLRVVGQTGVPPGARFPMEKQVRRGRGRHWPPVALQQRMRGARQQVRGSGWGPPLRATKGGLPDQLAALPAGRAVSRQAVPPAQRAVPAPARCLERPQAAAGLRGSRLPAATTWLTGLVLRGPVAQAVPQLAAPEATPQRHSTPLTAQPGPRVRRGAS